MCYQNRLRFAIVVDEYGGMFFSGVVYVALTIKTHSTTERDLVGG